MLVLVSCRFALHLQRFLKKFKKNEKKFLAGLKIIHFGWKSDFGTTFSRLDRFSVRSN